MARPTLVGRPAIRDALAAAVWVYAFAAVFSLAAQAPQLRSITEGVYSAGQAARGQQLYKAQCGGMSRQCDGRHQRTAAGRR